MYKVYENRFLAKGSVGSVTAPWARISGYDESVTISVTI